MPEPDCEILAGQGSKWFWTLFDGKVQFLKGRRDGNYWRFQEIGGERFPGPNLNPLLRALFDTKEEAYTEAVKRAYKRICDLEEELSDQRAELKELLNEYNG